MMPMISAATKIFGVLCAAIFPFMVVYFQGTNVAGINFVAISFCTLMGSICRLGFDHAAFRVGTTNSSQHATWLLKLSIWVVLLCTVAVITPWFLTRWLPSLYRDQILLATIAILPFSLSWIYGEYLKGLGGFLAWSILNTTMLSTLNCGIYLVIRWVTLEDPRQALVAFVLASWITLVASLLTVGSILGRMKVSENPTPLVTDYLSILKSGLILFPISFAGQMQAWLDTLVLGAFRSPTEVAVLRLATRVGSGPGIISTMTNGFYAPRIAKSLQQSNRETFLANWRSSGRVPGIFAVLYLVVAGIVLIFASRSLGLEDSLPLFLSCFALITVGQIVNCVTGCVGYILLCKGWDKLFAWTSIANVFLNTVLQLIGVWLMGAVGSALATLITVSVVNLYLLTQAGKVLQVHPWGHSVEPIKQIGYET